MITATPDNLTELQEARDSLLMRREIAELTQYVNGLEQFGRMVISESAGPFPWVGNDPLRDDPHGPSPDAMPIDLIGDREGGQDRPIFQTEIELARIRGTGRWLANNVPPAIGIIRNLVNYVIGTSWSYEAGHDDESDKELAADVNEFVTEWTALNAWIGAKDREAYRRSKRDGEVLAALLPLNDGMSRVQFEEPSYLAEPAGNDTRELEDWIARGGENAKYRCRHHPRNVNGPSCWRFGVHSHADDPETVYGFHVIRNTAGTNWDYIPEHRAELFKATCDSGVKRGVSEFWPCDPLLRKGTKVFSNTADGAALQAAIAWIRENAPGASGSGMTPVDGRIQLPNSTGHRTVEAVKYPSPCTLTVPANQKYLPGPMGSQRNPNLILAGQAALRLAGSRWNMPEWMVSSDASNNNYASSLVAESPFVKSAEAEQHTFARSAESLVWKAIRIAWEAGKFRKHNLSFDQIRRRVTLNITPTPVATRNQLDKAQEDQIKVQMGTKSRRTVAHEDGLDFDIEQSNMRDDGDISIRNTMSPAQVGSLQGALRNATTESEVRQIIESIAKRYP